MSFFVAFRLPDVEVASKVDAYRGKLMSEGRKELQKRDEFGRVQ